jgi:hypothetical protein
MIPYMILAGLFTAIILIPLTAIIYAFMWSRFVKKVKKQIEKEDNDKNESDEPEQPGLDRRDEESERGESTLAREPSSGKDDHSIEGRWLFPLSSVNKA